MADCEHQYVYLRQEKKNEGYERNPGAEGGYRCDICGEPVADDGPSYCTDCLHIPGRRVVRGRLNEEERQKWWNEGFGYGWTYTWKNWTWEPIGDGSGEGVIVRKPLRRCRT